MTLRLAIPEEAEALWRVRNLAIRAGCKSSYNPDVIARWTPGAMPENYRQVIRDNPFYVVENASGQIVATGYLALDANSVEAIFTAPDAAGQGLAKRIIEAIKTDAIRRGIARLTLASTPNAQGFYQKLGFITQQESHYPSALAGADLRCFDMAIDLGRET